MTYTIILSFILIVSLFKRNKGIGNMSSDKKYIVLMFVILWLLSAVRYQEAYSDFRTNVIGMIRIRALTFSDILQQGEFFHLLFRKVISIFFHDPQWYFIISAFIINYAIMLFAYRYIKNIPIYIIMYYCVFYYFTFNNITRQGLAVAFAVLGYINLLRKQKKLYIIDLIVAVLFHRSAFVAILPLALMRVSIKKTTILVYLVLFFIMAVANRPITAIWIRYIYTGYDSGYGTDSANPLNYIYVIMAILFVNAFINSYFNENDEGMLAIRYKNNVYDSTKMTEIAGFVTHGTIIYAMCIMLSCINMLMYARVAMYFIPCFAMCIDQVIQKSRNKNRRVLSAVLILFSVLIFAVMNTNGKLNPTPYIPFWRIANRLM